MLLRLPTQVVTFVVSVILCMAVVSCAADTRYLSDSHTLTHITETSSPISLDQLCAALSSSNCPLACVKSEAHLELQVYLHNRRLRDVMSALARLLNGNWLYNSKTHGYLFYIRRNQLAYAEKWWTLFMAQRASDRLRNNRGALAALSAPQHYTFTSSTVGGGQSGSAQEEALDRAEDFVAANRQAFLYRLPGPIRRQLAVCHYGWSQYLCSDAYGTSMYFVSPGDVLVSTLHLSPWYLKYVKVALLPFGIPPASLSTRPLSLQLSNQNGNFTALYVRPDGIKFNLVNGMPIANAMLTPVDQSYLPAFVKDMRKKSKSVPSVLAQLATYASTSVWPSTAVTSKALPEAASNQGGAAQLPPSRADKLTRIAIQGKQDIVADYTWQRAQPLTASQIATPLRGTVVHALNRCSIATDSSWHKCESGIIVDRNNRWYRDGQLSVPHGFLKDALSALKQVRASTGDAQVAAELSLDAKVWRTLTPWQLMNGFKWAELIPKGQYNAQLVFAPLYAQIRQSWPTIQFCTILSSEQIHDLANGGLQLSTLSSSQIQSLRTDLPALVYYAPQALGQLKLHIIQDDNLVMSSNRPNTMPIYGKMFPRLLLQIQSVP